MKHRSKRPPSSAAAAASGMFVLLVASPPPTAFILDVSGDTIRWISPQFASAGPPLLDITPTSTMLTGQYSNTGRSKYMSGFVANNAKTKMYAVPFSGETQVLELTATAPGEVPKIAKLKTNYDTLSYAVAQLNPRQDKIYAAPYNASRFLQIDPASGTAKTIDHEFEATSSNQYKYRGCSTPLFTSSHMYCKKNHLLNIIRELK